MQVDPKSTRSAPAEPFCGVVPPAPPVTVTVPVTVELPPNDVTTTSSAEPPSAPLDPPLAVTDALRVAGVPIRTEP